MKAKSDILLIHNILPTLGLVFLLLISPCKVRNFIQAELGIPLTQVTNKSQTTINNSNCSVTETATITRAKEKFQSQKLPFIATNTDVIFSTVNFNSSYPQKYKEGIHLAAAVPLYILHQNFKDYL